MWQLVGQTRVVSFLQRSLERGTLAHAYLLVGPPQVGKMTLALDLARALNCEAAEAPCGTCESCQKIASAKHADVQIIDLAGVRNSGEAKFQTEISIDQIRDLQHSASLPPFEGTFKVFIIDGAELLSHEAANSLLKTLEEPVGKVIFILLTTSDRLLPTTIVSRCQRLELMPLAATEIESALHGRVDIETAKAKLLASLSEERFNYAFQLATKFSRNREPVRETLDLWLSWWRDLLLIKAACPNLITNADLEATLISHAQGYRLGQIRDFISSIELALEQLKQNANPQLALEVLMLSIPRRGE